MKEKIDKEFRLHILVCAGTGCVANNSFEIKKELEKEILAIRLLWSSEQCPSDFIDLLINCHQAFNRMVDLKLLLKFFSATLSHTCQ